MSNEFMSVSDWYIISTVCKHNKTEWSLLSQEKKDKLVTTMKGGRASFKDEYYRELTRQEESIWHDLEDILKE